MGRNRQPNYQYQWGQGRSQLSQGSGRQQGQQGSYLGQTGDGD